jgi:uncharacterized protein
MGIDEVLAEKRKEILSIAKMHGARNVRVFGSVARGEADDRSDIDFLVDMEPGRSLLAWAGCKPTWNPRWHDLWMLLPNGD